MPSGYRVLAFICISGLGWLCILMSVHIFHSNKIHRAQEEIKLDKKVNPPILVDGFPVQ